MGLGEGQAREVGDNLDTLRSLKMMYMYSVLLSGIVDMICGIWSMGRHLC